MNQTEALNKNISYFLVATIKPSELNPNFSKTFSIKEAIPNVNGLNIMLKDIGDYFIYTRAVIRAEVPACFIFLFRTI